jgi:chromosome segregation ATPase
MNPAVAYGTTRTRSADVSYGQIEAAAQAILLTGVRPTVDGIREALKAGSQRTLLTGLQRFWKELGERLSGVPDTRRRLPASVADLADSLWQTALTMATEGAEGSAAAMKSQLGQLRTDMDVQGHALAQREIELDSLVRSRERTIRELEEHLRATLALVNKRDATIASLESRLATALAETESYRQRLAMVVTEAVKKHRATAKPPARLRSARPAPPKRRVTRSTRPAISFKPRAKKKLTSKRKKSSARRLR